MMAGTTVAIVILCYYLLLLVVAYYADHRRIVGHSVVSNGIIYTLSLGIWHTSWTFYGNVGRVATIGIDFIAIYFGATLIISSWWFVLRKIVRISKEQNLISIADFMAFRYGKSAALGALVTLLAVMGTLPYIALQLKGVAATIDLLAKSSSANGGGVVSAIDMPLVVALMLGGFSVLFGARTLAAASRHEGLVAAVAVESIVKLVALAAVGLFVCFKLFDGPGDIFAQFYLAFPDQHDLLLLDTVGVPYSGWLALAVVCMLAFMCLPHMFHIMVVENSAEKHIKTAMWGFPLYMVAINLFIVPIAIGGLLLSQGGTDPEYFTLLLPLQNDQPWLALLVFIGGFSGASSMVLVASLALSTLILNNLLMPIILHFRVEQNDISRTLLIVKRLIIVAVVYCSYLFYQLVGESYTLVNIGIISFVAVAQFAPALFIGLFWRRACLRGAWWGMITGFMLWFYTLLLPSFVRSGWLNNAVLDSGLFGFKLLRPEALFGLVGLPGLPHALFWSLLFNVTTLVLISCFSSPERCQNDTLQQTVDVFCPKLEEPSEQRISTAPTVMEFIDLMTKFIGEKRSHAAISSFLDYQEIDAAGRLSDHEIATLKSFTEKTLAGSVGTAPARIILDNYLASRGSQMEDVFDIFGSVTISRKAGREQLAILHEAARLVASGRDVQDVFDSILHLLRNEFKFDLCIIRLFDEQRQSLTVRSQLGMSPEHLESGDRQPSMDNFPGQSYVSNSVTVINDTDLLEKGFTYQLSLQEGFKSFAHSPISITDKPVGVISVFSKTAKGIFTDEFIELYSSLAKQVAVAWRNSLQTNKLIAAREHEREMQIAQTIQLSLLPTSIPQIAGIQLAGKCVPAREVGGDYYDFLPRTSDDLNLVVADVSGHNVGAAFIMTEARTFIQARARQFSSVKDTLEEFNRFFYDDLTRTEYFITMFYLHYQVESRCLSFANAGHNTPMLSRAGQTHCLRLDAEGLIFGVMEEYSFEEQSIELQDDDVLLLYTDGVTEAENSEGAFFGEDRLCSLLGQYRHLPPQQLIDALMSEVRQFVDGDSFNDDVSLVVMKVVPDSGIE